MVETNLPDFSDKVVAVELSADPDIPFTVIGKPKFENQAGRVFLCGVVPHGVAESNNWCADAPVAVAWESVIAYYVFDDVDELNEKTEDDD